MMKLLDFKMKVDLEQYEIAQEILSQLGYNSLHDVVKQSKLNSSNNLWLILENGKLYYDPFVDFPLPCEVRELTFMQFLSEVNKREYWGNFVSKAELAISPTNREVADKIKQAFSNLGSAAKACGSFVLNAGIQASSAERMFTCSKCDSPMTVSKGLLTVFKNHKDFGGDFADFGTTISQNSLESKIVDCLKCASCGHSYVPA